ncbi:MAG: RES family NAD+ phosphorylase [Sphingomonas sp.]|uniref:RES family NAD+ phosphorylase n=1 Tax=Sphingomonas sp. TaxID=28214 RepID=UPI003F80039F
MIPAVLDPDILRKYTKDWDGNDYLRTTPWDHRATPLGMGYGNTRFASTARSFRLLYIAETLPASLAEAVVRDRFEGVSPPRQMTRGEFTDWGVCEVDTSSRLRLLDLTGNACFDLGVSTDIAGGKAQDEAREFSERLYATTDLDGILYHSRLQKLTECVAVYDRAVGKLAATPVSRLETLVDLIPALEALNIQLI